MSSVKLSQTIFSQFRTFENNLMKMIKRNCGDGLLKKDEEECIKRLLLDLEVNICSNDLNNGSQPEIPLLEKLRATIQVQELTCTLREKELEFDVQKKAWDTERNHLKTTLEDLSAQLLLNEQEYQSKLHYVGEETMRISALAKLYKERLEEYSETLQKTKDLTKSKAYVVAGINGIAAEYSYPATVRSSPCYSLFSSVQELFKILQVLTREDSMKSDQKLINYKNELKELVKLLNKNMMNLEKVLSRSNKPIKMSSIPLFLESSADNIVKGTLQQWIQESVHDEADADACLNIFKGVEQIKIEMGAILEQQIERERFEKKEMKAEFLIHVNELRNIKDDLASYCMSVISDARPENCSKISELFKNLASVKRHLSETVETQKEQLQMLSKELEEQIEKCTESEQKRARLECELKISYEKNIETSQKRELLEETVRSFPDLSTPKGVAELLNGAYDYIMACAPYFQRYRKIGKIIERKKEG